ncbi:MAG: hypothetical protein VXZ45_04670, partial [Verrucomicrobiota bacterium]|nr:hypothetical protein [Verrucomicrobiota bacterium]
HLSGLPVSWSALILQNVPGKIPRSSLSTTECTSDLEEDTPRCAYRSEDIRCELPMCEDIY